MASLLRPVVLVLAIATVTGGRVVGADAPSADPLRAAAPGGLAVQDAAPWPPPSARVEWTSPQRRSGRVTRIQLLGINDFHGNLEPPTRPNARPAGGAGVLAAYLEAAQRRRPGRTLILHAGDQVGASPPISRLLADEPAIDFLNLLAGPHCDFGHATASLGADQWHARPNRCNVVGTLGNHEFDRGPDEILRLLQGGTATGGPFLDAVYRGSRVPYVCANVRDRRTGRTLLPPYAVVSIAGLPVGVIGAVVRETPTLVQAWAVADLEFLDEADSINAAAAELSRAGIHAIVVIIHQGVVPIPTSAGFSWRGRLADIVARLDADVDVVISGHTHAYTNALMPNAAQQPVLVTQAYSYGLAYADIELEIDRHTLDVVAKSAQIVPTWRDSGPGLHPAARALALTAAASRAVAPLIARVVGEAAEPITRRIDAAGESGLGDLVADAERAISHADIALVNAGGMRADLDRGPITWGDILTLHPFGNRLLTSELSGATILRTLEEQWRDDPSSLPQILKTSGLSYVWDPSKPPGHRVVAACDADGHPLDPERRYRVTINDFLAAGGDGFLTLKAVATGTPGPTDAEALAAYLASAGAAVERHAEGRIARADRLPGGRCPFSEAPR